jgi:hypothetical protein
MENTNFFSSKEGNKNPEFIFVYASKERQRKPGSDRGRATTVANPGPLGSAQKKNNGKGGVNYGTSRNVKKGE